MQAHVKTPHIDISIRGEISPRVLTVLRREYGQQLVIDEDDDNDLVEVVDSNWYRETKAKSVPGDALRIYRENHKLTPGTTRWETRQCSAADHLQHGTR